MKIFRKAYKLIFINEKNAKSVALAFKIAKDYKRVTELPVRDRNVLKITFELEAIRKHLKKCKDLKNDVLNTVAELRIARDSHKEVTRDRRNLQRWSRASLIFFLHLPRIEQRARHAEQLCIQASIRQRATRSLVQRLNEELGSFILLFSDRIARYLGEETTSKLRELLSDHKAVLPGGHS